MKLKISDEELNDIAKGTSVSDAINEILDSYKKSTKVVGWYAHPYAGEVRGPFNRWLTVSNVPDKYKKDVAEKSDDTLFASNAMNLAPKLAIELVKSQSKVDKLMQIVEMQRDALIKSGTDISNALVWTSGYSAGFVRQSVDRTNTAITETDKMLKELNGPTNSNEKQL